MNSTPLDPPGDAIPNQDPVKFPDPNDDDGNGKSDDYNGWSFPRNSNAVIPKAIVETGKTHNGYAETHGTTVAGIIAGQGNNDTGIAGLGWNTKILPISIGDNVNESANVRIKYFFHALKYIRQLYDKGVNLRVVNASVLFPKIDVVSSDYSRDIEGAIASLENRGIFIIAAAGNQGKNIDIAPDGTITPQWYPIGYTNSNIIGVAMTNEDLNTDHLQLVSNFGEHSVDIAAPGGQYEYVTGTLPDGTYSVHNSHYGIFSTIWQTGTSTLKYAERVDRAVNSNQAISTIALRGTSFATPMVAGTIALMLSQYPEATISQIRTALLENTSTDTMSFTDDSVWDDDNLPDELAAPASGQKAGRLNSFKAIQQLRSRYLSGGAGVTILGDIGGFATDDYIRVKYNSSLNKTEIRQIVGGVDKPVARITNDNSNENRIAIFGLKGNDRIVVESGVYNQFYIHGGEGDDTIYGGPFADSLFGGGGRDVVYGGAGNDVIYGDNKLDSGGNGSDTLFGQDGNDQFHAIDGIKDFIWGGAGTDTYGNEFDSIDDFIS